jgi:penicillin-binding protein 2
LKEIMAKNKHYKVAGIDQQMEINDAVLTLSEGERAKIEWPLSRGIFGVFFGVAIIILVIFSSRFVYLNGLKGAEYRTLSQRNSIRSIIIPAPRGIITDRFGQPLVNNVPSIDLVLTPIDVPTDPLAQENLKNELRALNVPDDVLQHTFDALDPKSPKQVLLRQNISQDEALVFLERSTRLPGVTLFKTTQRSYINGPVFSHLLGYEGKIHEEELKEHPDYHLTDTIGKQGIEKSYESALRGEYGYQQGEVDSLGHIKKDLGVIQPKTGKDLVLHIDADLQQKLTDAMLQQLQKAGIRRGAAVAIDPRSGAVRAVVSLPSFDNNLFARGITQDEYAPLATSEDRPLFNRAFSGAYAPGSTIKPLHAAAALAEKIIDPSYQIESRGGIQVGNFFFGDWKAHGFTDIRRAIAVSSDVYFYSVGGGYGGIQGLGIERMKKYDNLFGYGELSGIDVPGEVPGFFPTKEWKKDRFGEQWYLGDDYNSSIGQGYITVTALQIVNSIATVANGGTLYVPQVVAAEKSVDGSTKWYTPQAKRSGFIAPDILQVVREGMRETVTEGTAQPLKDLPVEVAGKTGTAQFGSQEKTQGWFVSYAPYQSPELALVILFEGQDKTETYNGVPVTKEVYAWYFSDEQKQKRAERAQDAAKE